MEVIKELKGHSGSVVLLLQEPNKSLFVRKIGNVVRNVERLTALKSLDLPVCKIINTRDNEIDLEYIHGLDIANYLLTGSYLRLADFLIDVLRKLSISKQKKNYLDDLENSLSWVDQTNDLPFSKKELLARLQLNLYSSEYHGDLTLENIIYSNNNFYLIDAVTTNYDSYIFDIAKLRQDLECGWFLRNKKIQLGVKLTLIQNALLEEFPEARCNYYLILMLLRVYLHTKPNDRERAFILTEVNRLWL